MNIDELINWPLAAVLIVLVAGLGALVAPLVLVRTRRQEAIDRNEAENERIILERKRSLMLRTIEQEVGRPGKGSLPQPSDFDNDD